MMADAQMMALLAAAMSGAAMQPSRYTIRRQPEYDVEAGRTEFNARARRGYVGISFIHPDAEIRNIGKGKKPRNPRRPRRKR